MSYTALCCETSLCGVFTATCCITGYIQHYKPLYKENLIDLLPFYNPNLFIRQPIQLIDQLINHPIHGLDLSLHGLFLLRRSRGCEILVQCQHGLDQCTLCSAAFRRWLSLSWFIYLPIIGVNIYSEIRIVTQPVMNIPSPIIEIKWMGKQIVFCIRH